MSTLKGCLAALLCLGATPGSTQTVDELLAHNLAARGGAAKLAARSSLRLTGKIVFGATEAALAELRARGGKLRSEVTLQGLTQVEAHDGREAWNLDPFEGRREAQKESQDEARVLAYDADLDGPLVGWKEKGYHVAYLGTEDVDGTAAHKLRVDLKDGDFWTVYLDPDSFLEVRIVRSSRVRGVEQVTETDLGSYQMVDGIAVPFSIDSGRPGRPKNVRTTFERAESNVPAGDALFRFPPPGTSIAREVLPGPAAARPTGASVAPRPKPGNAPDVALDAGILSGLGARNIGSAAMSGRVAALAARTDKGRTTVFVGAASGGVWRSQDDGTTFKPVFDKAGVQSIGALAIDPSNPRNVWVGTGEAWTRNSVSIGDGIYRSTDGGETFANVGLPESERIVRIVVHPKKSEVVFACVPGKLWSDSRDRGLYRTTDAGKTWALVLSGPNASTGCSSVSLAPDNPDALLAGLWDFRRQGWTFRSGGDGPEAPSGSGLHRSTDGGTTWTEVPAGERGLPARPWGRVEVVHAPSDARVVYALVEAKDSALFRSSDGGATWEARDKSQMMVWRPFYFARLVVDPTNPDRLFKAGGDLIASEDGGRSFSSSGGGGHGDWHDVWIDPENPRHVLGGDDGGLWLSRDGGSRWWKSNNLPISQFYHVAADDRDPYQVYGGLQDNSSWVGDSAYPGGITNQRWESFWFGDGFWMLPDPTDPDAVYAEAQGGYLGRVDRRTRSARNIQPMAGPHEKLRFNWNTPLHVSPTQRGTLYVGAQFLFRSRDRGDSWERISPDLTTNDPARQTQEESGGITVDNSAAEMHTTIFSISESPKDPATIWVGTDDGNLQLTRDGGKSWTNVVANVPGLPARSWVSWVEASRFDAAIAYAAFDRHTAGDMTAWVYRTGDAGRTWTRIASPEQGVRGYAHVIKEDTVTPSLLFLGTELGLWISVDGGLHWARFEGGGFPAVAVRDLQVQARENDLVLATHGRGIWIVDDISPLRALDRAALQTEVGFLPGRPVQQRMVARGGWVEGDATFVGENPAAGAVITFYQRARHVWGPLSLDILDASGKLVDTISPPKRRGLNRITWSMQVKPPRVPRAAQLAFGASRGPRVPPGTYTLRLHKGDRVVESKLAIGLDVRAPYGAAERQEQFDAVMRVHALFGSMTDLVERIEATRAAASERASKLGADPLGERARTVAARAEELKKRVVATKEGGAITGEERLREHTETLYNALMLWEGRPARYQVERIDTLTRELGEVSSDFAKLQKDDVEPLDAALQQRKLPGVSPR